MQAQTAEHGMEERISSAENIKEEIVIGQRKH